MSSIITSKETASTFSKLQKLTQKLLALHHNGSFYNIPAYKQYSLVKRHNRYLSRMIKADHPVSKAVGLFAVAMLLSVESQAQAPCRAFANAEKDNPFKLLTLPFKLTKPVFVDIDNDGDLDCYGVYPDSLENVRFAFLRNTGTKKLPFFKLESTGGLPYKTAIRLHRNVEGMVFSDLDGDGDYDCFIGNYLGGEYNEIVYFENVGNKTSPSFVVRSGPANPLYRVPGAYELYFNLVDLDADGDYDLFTSDLYYTRFYKNKGTKTNPDFVFVWYQQTELAEAHTIFIDWDKDGLTDLIRTQAHLPQPYTNGFYKNKGTIDNPLFSLYEPNPLAGPVFPLTFNLYSLVDLNNDGFQEAFSYTATMASTAPVATITAVQKGQTVTLQAYPKGNYTYEWKRNRVTIPNQTKDSLKVTQSGNYIVLIKGKCGTGISLPYKVTINTAVASLPDDEDLSASINITPQLHVYPNPFTNECVLKFNKGITGNSKIYIMDVQGRTVTTLQANNNGVRFGKELAAGIYFIQVMDGKEVILRQKIVKQ